MSEKLNNEVRKTMESLDNIERLGTDPYFYTRLKARMDLEKSSISMSWKWSLASVVILVILNSIVFLRSWPEYNSEAEAIEMLANEYGNTWPSIYNSDLIYENE